MPPSPPLRPHLSRGTSMDHHCEGTLPPRCPPHPQRRPPLTEHAKIPNGARRAAACCTSTCSMLLQQGEAPHYTGPPSPSK